LKKNIDKIEDLIKSVLNSEDKSKKSIQVYLNFKIEDNNWFDFHEELEILNRKILSEFFFESKQGLSLRKSLYKTIAAPEEDLQFPDFSERNLHKVKSFASIDQALDLIYAIDYSKKPIISEKNIKIIILPKGENLRTEHIYSNKIGMR
jgi:hypothetical protein